MRGQVVVLDDATHESRGPLVPGAGGCAVLITGRLRPTPMARRERAERELASAVRVARLGDGLWLTSDGRRRQLP